MRHHTNKFFLRLCLSALACCALGWACSTRYAWYEGLVRETHAPGVDRHRPNYGNVASGAGGFSRFAIGVGGYFDVLSLRVSYITRLARPPAVQVYWDWENSMWPIDEPWYGFVRHSRADWVGRHERYPTYSVDEYWLDVPWWLLCIVAAAYPALGAYRRYRFHLRKKHAGPDALLCNNCGYDMCATPTCCPECGEKKNEGGT